MSKKLWLTWTVLTASGWGIGLLAGLLLGAPIQFLIGVMLVTPVVTCLVGGILGTGQWLALRKYRSALWWIPASALGLGLGLTIGVTLVEHIGRWWTGGPVNVARLTTLERAASFAVIGITTGLALGSAQWLVLRRVKRQNKRWIAMTALAMTVAMVLASLLADATVGSVAVPLGFLTFLILSGCILGILTGHQIRSVLETA